MNSQQSAQATQSYGFHIVFAPSRRLLKGSVALAVLAAALALVPYLSGQEPAPSGESTSQPAVETPATGTPGVAAGLPTPAVGDLLRQVQQRLVETDTLQARLLQQVYLGSEPMQLVGRYASRGVKLRLEYQVQSGGKLVGQLVEVCDGDVLWSRFDVLETRRVTRRDIREIVQAAREAGGTADAVLAAELGLGGLPALFASLQRNMTFDSVTQDHYAEHDCWVLVGEWSEEFRKQLGGPKRELPAHVPDRARLFIDRETLLPVRIAYDKRRESDLVYNPLVNFEFSRLIRNEPVDDQLFTFVPPDDVVPEDVTRQYVEMIRGRADAAAAAPPANQPAP